MVAKTRQWPWSAIIDLLILATWGVMLTRFWVGGRLSLLLHPNYHWLSNGAAVLFLVMAAIRAIQIGRHVGGGFLGWRTNPEDHVNLLPRQVSILLLISVAVFGLIFIPQPFSSETALQRGISETAGQTRSRPQRFVRSRSPEERTIIDWVRTLSVYPEPDAYTDQAVNVSGFVIHPPNWPTDVFMVARFVLTCCAADAYPVGLPVHLGGAQEPPAPDTWLAVQGTMQTQTLVGKRQLVIIPSRLEPIPEPSNPYEF